MGCLRIAPLRNALEICPEPGRQVMKNRIIKLHYYMSIPCEQQTVLLCHEGVYFNPQLSCNTSMHGEVRPRQTNSPQQLMQLFQNAGVHCTRLLGLAEVQWKTRKSRRVSTGPCNALDPTVQPAKAPSKHTALTSTQLSLAKSTPNP